MRALAACALAIVASAAIAGDERQALELIQSCNNDVADDARGIVALEKACPGVWDALKDLHLAERLQGDWEKTIDRDALNELVALQTRYARSPSAGVSKESLKTSLDELRNQSPVNHSSWWDRAKAWLRGLLSPDSDESPQWLRRLLEKLSISDAWLRVLVYVLVILVVGMAVGVVVVEWRAARISGKGGVAGAGNDGTSSGNRKATRLSLADVDAAPWRERPILLLRLTVQRLIELERLQSESSLTHRELAQRARFQKSVDHERFERLTGLAERMRFGVRTEQPDNMEGANGVLAEGRSLFDDLAAERKT